MTQFEAVEVKRFDTYNSDDRDIGSKFDDCERKQDFYKAYQDKAAHAPVIRHCLPEIGWTNESPTHMELAACGVPSIARTKVPCRGIYAWHF